MTVRIYRGPGIKAVVVVFHSGFYAQLSKVAFSPVAYVNRQEFLPRVLIGYGTKCINRNRRRLLYHVLKFQQRKFGLSRSKDAIRVPKCLVIFFDKKCESYIKFE